MTRGRCGPHGWLLIAAHGQALVEFALVLPVALLLVLGMIDLGRAMVFGIAVQQGARESVRLASLSASTSSISDQVVLQRLIDASAPALVGCTPIDAAQDCGGGTWTFTIAPGGTPKPTGTQVVVTARGVNISLFAGFLMGAMGLGVTGFTVQGQAAMVVL